MLLLNVTTRDKMSSGMYMAKYRLAMILVDMFPPLLDTFRVLVGPRVLARLPARDQLGLPHAKLAAHRGACPRVQVIATGSRATVGLSRLYVERVGRPYPGKTVLCITQWFFPLDRS